MNETNKINNIFFYIFYKLPGPKQKKGVLTMASYACEHHLRKTGFLHMMTYLPAYFITITEVKSTPEIG